MATLASAFGWLGLGNDRPRTRQDRARFDHSPSLIPKLKHDHAALLKLYREIETMAVEGRYAQIAAALAQFKSKLDLHILEEDLRFYCYVEERRAGHPADRALIKGFRVEMNALARAVAGFAKKYRMTGVRPSNGIEFLDELRVMGKALVRRVEHEEGELYTLYEP